jgi:DNA (cytosine-5)-methyltransferase 1
MTDQVRPLRVGDAFAGIGGMSLGLHLAGGFETRWFIEIDEFCQRVLAKHWPNVPQYGDIRDVRGSDLPTIDVLTAGVPCQPASVAGQQRGAADERWLWGEFARLVRELRPRWVLAENPTGILSVDAGRGFGTVLRELAESGYDAEWQSIPASAVGAPHIRDRVWLVAYANGNTPSKRGQRANVPRLDWRWPDDRGPRHTTRYGMGI